MNTRTKQKIKTVRFSLSFFMLILVLCFVTIWALMAGSYDITASQAFHVVAAKLGLPFDVSHIKPLHETIIWKIRIPRIFLAILGGIALATAGTSYQGAFRNPLVEPYILGVSSGAACGAALAIVFPHIFPNIQIMAFIFALFAVFLASILATQDNQRSPVSLVLAGIIIGALFSAIVGIMKYIAPDTALRELTFWMMGGFYHASWSDVSINALVIIPCFFILLAMSWRINVLSLGDDEARSLGIHPTFTRYILLFTATLGAAVCVSTVGIIAWVGLMMPHAARLIFGQDNRMVMPASAIMGAMYMLLCDTLARTIVTAEIPVGIITSIVGAPYLLWLLRTKGQELYEK